MNNLTPTPSACKNSPELGPDSPQRTGVFPHARWRRRGAFETDSPSTRYESARYDLARLSTWAIIERSEAISRHTHARWSAIDRATHDELVARCWGMGEISSLRMMGLPRWLEPLLSKVSPTGRRMARPGWRPFLALVIGAFRSGAAGVRLTLDELAAELGMSRSTCTRYVAELVAVGLLRRIKVSREVTGAKEMKRANDSNVYQVGPVLLANWHAILEGCSSRVAYGGPNAKRARFAAHELRQDARQFRRSRELTARASHPSPGLPGHARRPDVGGYSVDVDGQNPDAFRRPSQSTKIASPPVPPRGITDAELDALELELIGQSAQRSSVGAASNLEPAALAEGRGPAGVARPLPRSKGQSKLTTRSRSTNRDRSGPKGPRPSASAAGSKLEAAPTLERCALCRGSSADEKARGSRCSHSLDTEHSDPGPQGESKSQATTAPARSPSLAGKITTSEPETPQRTTRGEQPRATTTEAQADRPPALANYDWRRGLREHVSRGGSLRFLDPRLRAELGFDDDQDDDQDGEK